MRLKQIKLAGFKSFVDATKIPFLQPLTAVIGPNGCGKSNVIDAVRWVLGESSAKNLRGDSWADVIFNGSNARKPVSVASVELVFDNTEGRIGGAYASYDELAVRRQVSRDGENLYYLNGQKCRRKDITDIFMGTGLGPRSYAIIGQGTISRLIECKPQELRIFIEEAAGISRYKERRRDTENRIRHTRENLDRLGDIRAELGKHLEKLTIQAQAAKRYREYKQQERTLHAQLLVMRYLELHQLAEAENSEIARLETEQLRLQTVAEHLGLQLTELKLQQDDLEDVEQRQVADYYQSNTDIAKTEQQIKFLREQDQHLAKELARITTQQQQVQEQLRVVTEKEQQLQASLATLQPAQEQLDETHWELNGQLETLEEQLQQASEKSRQATAALSELRHQQELAATREQHLKQRLEQDRQQLQRLTERLAGDSIDDDADKQSLEFQLATAQTQLVQLQQQYSLLQQQQTEAQSCLQQRQQAVQEQRQQLSALQTRHQMLGQWLAAQQPQADVGDLPQLWQEITIATGWEPTVEQWLNPLLAKAIAEMRCEQGFRRIEPQRWGPVTAPVNLSPWLAQVHWADTAADAQKLQTALPAAAVILCAEGSVWGRDFCWLLQGNQDSLVAMAAEQDKLAAMITEAEQQLVTAEEVAQRAQQSARAAVTALEQGQQQLQQQQLQQAKAQMVLDNALARTQQQAQQRQQLLDDKNALTDRIANVELDLEALIESQFAADDELYQRQGDDRLFSEQASALTSQRIALKSRLGDIERQLRDANRQLNEQQTALALVQQQAAQQQAQQQQLQQQLLELQQNRQPESVDGDAIAVLEQQLAQLLRQQQQQHQSLEQTRARIADLQKQSESLSLKQKQQLAEAEHLTQSISTLKLRREGLKGQAESQLAQLQEQQIQLSAIADNLPAEAATDKLQAELDAVRNRISRLGAINLAAIDEFEQQKERKTYLDEQDKDLNQALASLEEAIRRIDRETRSRFKTTFEQVNNGLGELFPKVFGGGSAYLALTDDDLLETGVTIMARPPGKKNSTIHLLSGGEKALTALSLVFAIFRLNPAPFCMLDEVDAPLDDANVDRFCRLLQEMSQNVQFIYISHNKITMEMADQLIGVTMHEPGVSRIVAVNIEEAVAMADAG
ncbi:chromosome segregation protein SMC [Shewanella dokdonensis]|uniref:chromosome segregation protein SMC n=1 Tax=Shewanella dokdonensis TaxID=712036 RepID=UPI0020108B3A|nr:chromosome segregation protein SMC [Shewanella dokdonensis]MCL1074854.1 chromosome segregation protein SMC [Shewanella dokdonensis]